MVALRSSLLVLVAALVAACGGARKLPEVEDPELLRAAWEQMRVERAWPKTQGIVPGLDPARLGVDGRNPSTNVSFHALLCQVEDRQFYFVTNKNPSGSGYQLSWLEVGATRPLQPAASSIEDQPGGRRLWFGAHAAAGGLAVLYPDGPRVIELRATITDQGLSFGAPRTIATANHGIMRLQLTQTDDRLHAIWVAGDGQGNSLTYSSTPSAELAWTKPRVLSTSVLYDTGCLAAADRDVYVAWCDERYRTRRNFFDPYRNDGKVFLTVSRDGGRTFADPVVLNEPGQHDDVAQRVVLAVGRGGLAVSWLLPEPGPAHGTFFWRTAAVDLGLQRMHRGARVGSGYDGCW